MRILLALNVSPLDVADASTLRVDVPPDGAEVWLSAGPADNSPAVYVAESVGWRLVTAPTANGPNVRVGSV